MAKLNEDPQVQKAHSEKLALNTQSGKRAVADPELIDASMDKSRQNMESAINQAISDGMTKEDILGLLGDDTRNTSQAVREEASDIYDTLTAPTVTPSKPEYEFSSDQDLYNIPADFDDNGTVIIRKPEATSELSTMISTILPVQAEQVGLELDSGDDTTLSQAEQYLRGIIHDEKLNATEVALQKAETPEESLTILKEASEGTDGVIGIKELREYFVQARLNPRLRDSQGISAHIENNLALAAELDKLENRVWEQTNLLGVLGDLGELVIPASGYAEEEYMKYQNTLDGILAGMKYLKPEEQMKYVNAVVDTWVESETLLLGNNNSLLVADRIDSFRDAVLDGSSLYIDGSISEEQFHDVVQTALFGTVAAGEFRAVGKGLVGVMKFMLNSIFPKKPKEAPKTEFTSEALEGEYIPFVDSTEVSVSGDAGLSIFRTGSRAVDSEIAFQPESFQALKSEDMPKLLADNGVTEEQAMDRMAPSFFENPNTAWGNIWDETTEMNDLLLLDEEASTIGMHRARKLETLSGGSLKQIDSGTSLLPNDVPDSMGDFVITMGDGNKKGFQTADEAQSAGELGLAGKEFKVVKQNNQYYVQTQVQHQFDPTTDVTHLFETYSAKTNELSGFFIDPLRQFGDEVLDSVFTVKNINRGRVSKKIKEFNKAIRSWSPNKTILLNKALAYGDNNGVEFASKAEMASALGKVPSDISDKVWKSYKDVRGIMDDLYAVRNDNYRSLKENQGYRMYHKGDDSYLGKPVQKADSDILDPNTGQVIEKPYEGSVLIRLDETIQGGDGKIYRHVAVKPSDLTELPTQLLRKRTGHIDRGYRDTGWTVKVKGSRVVGGVEETYHKTTHILKNRKQATKAMQKMVGEEGLDPETVELVRARENPDMETIYGDPESAQYNYSPVHSRHRGEQLRGAEGLADTLAPLESIQKSIYAFQREFDQPFIQSLKTRFKNQFRDHLREGGKWSSDFDHMFDTAKASDETMNAAKRWHNYIQGIQRQQISPLMQFLDRFFEFLFGGMVNAPASELSRRVQRFTAQMVIVGRPLYQVPQNLLQGVYIAMKYPVQGTKSVAQMPFVIDALFRNDTKLLAKVLDVDDSTAKEFLDMMKKSGTIDDSVGRADDFLNLASDDFASSATNQFSFFYKKYAKEVIKTPLTASRHLQEGSIKLLNMYAMVAEFNEQVVRQGRKMNAVTKKDILFNAQKMTQTQNGMNQFLYQNTGNFASIMFQFMQHTHKLLLDVVLDPLVKATTGKNLGRSKSPLASSRAKAWGSLAGLYMLFGFNGIFGENGGNYFTDRIREEFPETENSTLLQPAFDGGMINMMVNEAFFGGEKGKADVTAVINPSSFIDSVWEFYLSDFGSLDVFGASASVAGSLKDAYDAGVALSAVPSEYMSTPEKAWEVGQQISEVYRGWSDYQRARAAALSGTWINKSTMSGKLKVTQEEAWLAMFNVTPKMVNDYYNKRGSFHGDPREEDVSKLAKTLVKMMNRELLQYKEDGKLDYPVFLETLTRYVVTAKASVDPLVHDSIDSAFKQYAMNIGETTYEEYMKPYMDTQTMEDRRKGLEGLLQKAETPEQKQEIKSYIEMMDMLSESSREVYGDKNE